MQKRRSKEKPQMLETDGYAILKEIRSAARPGDL
jgi:hypothetical protein